MALVLSFLISYQQYQNRVSFIKDELDNIVTANKSFIEQSLWILDTRALRLVMKAFLLNDNIVFAQITDENGKTIASNGMLDIDKNIQKTVSLYHQDEGRNIFLGKLTVAASKQSAFREAKASIFITLCQSMLLMFILSVSIIFIFWHLVSRHLLTIQQYTRHITLEAQQDPLKLNRPINKHTKNDELASTVDAINFMCRKAVKAYRKLEDEASEKIKLEQRLQQAQKMESVGRLAGGIAHDFNNALSIIIGFAELSLDEVEPFETLYDNLNEILEAAERATEIVKQLLAFARKQPIAPRVLSLNENIERTLKMLRRLIGEDIELVWHPGKCLGAVMMDPVQIDQILTNLCVNARDAIDNGGRITIETGNVHLDQAYCALHPGFASGDFVMLAVSDDGCGMEREILDNIFEPFFTTKGLYKGTGLGLATVYGIVKQNSGYINVYSEPGMGTTVKIFLPRHEAEEEKATGESQPRNTLGGNETILMVEDDLSILKLGRVVLEELGYTVLTSGRPEQALRLAERHAGTIHLLITDVIMPEMNGRELAEKLTVLHPGIGLVFMSGYTANVIARHGVLDKGTHFLQKPLSKDSLAQMVRKVLDEQKRDAAPVAG